jgi:SRR1
MEMINSTDNENNEGWKVVTAADKKRVMRKKRSNTSRAFQNAVAHPVAESQTSALIHQNQDDDDGDETTTAALNMILSSCRSQLQSTVFYQQLWTGLLSSLSLSLSSKRTRRRRPPPSCSSSSCSKEEEEEEVAQDGDDEKDDSSLAGGNDVDCILCLGVGNFSKTSLRHHNCYAPSLWQLACALQLREDLQEHQEENRKKKQVVSNVDKKDDEPDSPRNKNIEMLYYDIVTTSVEADFLRIQHGVRILPTNEQGKYRIVDHQQQQQPQTTSSSTSASTISSMTLCFMPHCPLFLYENLVAENWNQLHLLVIIGNSLIQQQQQQIVAVQETPRLKEATPYIVETLLDVCMIKKKSEVNNNTNNTRKNAHPPPPAEFVRAFNDTYLAYFNVPTP